LFDVLLLLELVEHVDDVQGFVRQAACHLKPGGLLLASTIDRTARSLVTAIVGTEYIFRLLPESTHHWARFVRPSGLRQAALACGLAQPDCRGMGYLPAVHHAWRTSSVSVNYISSLVKSAH
jgi:2-polyprenyl-6-hydroxyphenyl methylase/3-demethylubiquinone-9 3-methyltransferase